MGPSRIDRRWEIDLPNVELGPEKGFFQRLLWFHALVGKVKPDLVAVPSPMGAVMEALNRTIATPKYSIAIWMHTTPGFYGANRHML